MNNLKIYLKDSDKARLADIRCRIVRESDPLEPQYNEDLVFAVADDKTSIPDNALYTWQFDCNGEHEPFYFYTTAERCKKMVSDDPSYWTKEKLEEFARIEKHLYQDWWDGKVYGFIVEKWNNEQRKWETISSLWGMYGSEALLDNLKNEVLKNKMNTSDMVVCIDAEDMKYDFDNVEKTPNQFDA